MGILQDIKTRRIYFDGGMGSLLQERGLKSGELPETWNLTHPDVIENIHLEYLNAGVDIISANTFGVNGLKYKKKENYSVQEIVEAAISIAKRAIEKAGHGYVGLDLGPTGKLLKPYGTLEFEDACNLYKEVVCAGTKAGADLIIIETMGDSYELKAAVLAAKEECDLPVFATVTLDEKGKMLTGGDVESVTALLEGLGVDVIGLNCGLGPEQLLPIVEKMAQIASTPILVSPNAGLPRSDNGKTVYDIDVNRFAGAMKEIAGYASIMGGCCGTTPEYMKEMIEKCNEIPIRPVTRKCRTVISSYARTVVFGDRPILIGERINPTGKPRFKEALKACDLSYIQNIAVAQQESGADVLDVNVGLPGIDETLMMAEVIRELQSVTDLPLQIDTSNIEAMEHAMRIYNGKPLINSINGKTDVMDAVFPLVKKYGGVVVALCLDENGIPETADGRLAVAEKIYDRAAVYGIDRNDILVDTLCMAVSADTKSASTTLETVRRVRNELGGKTILGISNVSFGLPRRENINGAFFLMALQSGLSAAIINPNSDAMMSVYNSFMVLSEKDENCSHYIETYGTEHEPKHDEASMKCKVPSELGKSILFGITADAKRAVKELIGYMDPMDIISSELIPALDQVGVCFESGKIYLPQLLKSAEAAKAAFFVLKEYMNTGGQRQETREKVLLATVKGDIHDIGKNIVKVLLENYGFDVIDLGFDAKPEMIVETAVREQIRIVGLSALMTTTVPAMKDTIRLLKDAKPEVKIMVGGAVLTPEYADSIGAGAYCKDAMASVRYAVYQNEIGSI